MKKFEMPVVVLNEMTMNESIAADCCYSIKTEGLVTTKSILSGGSIGDHVFYTMKASIQNLYGSIGNMPKYHYIFRTPKASTTADTSAGWVTTPAYNTYDVAYVTLGAKTSDGWVPADLITFDSDQDTGLFRWSLESVNVPGAYVTTSGGACDHLGDCKFNTKTTSSNYHIDSTVKHLFGGTDWANPHLAQQYNS